jgi:hypothetical protein
MKLAIFMSLFLAQAALADNCVITTTRTACPGHEAESYSKCPGDVQTCSTTTAEASAADCEAAAVTACTNLRYTITKYKTVKATYDGSDFAHGEDFCARDSGSYIVSKNFPYKDKANCQ